MKTKKVVYKVTCCKNAEHKFRVVYEIEKNTGKIISRPTEFCPFCGEIVEVEVQGKIVKDTTIHRIA